MVSIYKIYREKTIEVGVYIDRHLYKNMEEVFYVISVLYPSFIYLWSFVSDNAYTASQVLKTGDEVKVKAQLLRMVHSLFLQVFQFHIRLFLSEGVRKNVF